MGSDPGKPRRPEKPRPTGDECLTPKQLAALLRVSHRTVEGWRLKGNGPKFVRVSERCLRLRRSDVDLWLESRVRRSTSDPGPEDEP